MLEDLNQATLRPGFWNDNEAAQKTLRKRAQAEAKLELATKMGRDIADLEEYFELGVAEGDPTVIEDAAKQASAIDARLGRAELERMLSGPADRERDPHHPPGRGRDRREGLGAMLMRMYLRWAEKRGIKTEVLDYQGRRRGRHRRGVHRVQGDNAYGYLRSGAGVHRLVRMSPFNADHTRQTAFAAVDVTPDADEDIDIDPRQGRRDHDDARRRQGRAEREQGRDGRPSAPPADRPQHRVPRERSQHQNRAMAMRILKAKLYEIELQKREPTRSQTQLAEERHQLR
jgi:peptide chain release factor 2